MSWVDQASHLESTWTLALALENTWDQPEEHLENTREHLDTGSGSTGQKVSTNQPGEKCGPNLAGENFAPNLPGRKSTWSNTWFSLKHGLVNMLCTPGWKSVWESGNLFGNLEICLGILPEIWWSIGATVDHLPSLWLRLTSAVAAPEGLSQSCKKWLKVDYIRVAKKFAKETTSR